MYNFKYKYLFIIIIFLISIINIQNCVLPKIKEDNIPRKCFFFKKIWSVYTGIEIKKIYSKLALYIEKNTIYISNNEGFIQAIDIKNGKKNWQIKIDQIFYKNKDFFSSGILIDQNKLYIGSEQGKIYSLDIKEKKIYWVTKLSGEIISSSIVSTNELLIVYTNKGIIEGINKKNGSIKWSTKIDDISIMSLRGNATPTIAYDYNLVIVGNNTGKIKAINIDTGKIIWEKQIAYPKKGSLIKKINDINSSPIIIDENIYAIAYNGYLSILNLHNGHLIWQNKLLKGSLHNLTVDKNKIIYLINQNNIIFAINNLGKNIIWKQDKLSKYKLSSLLIYNDKYIIVNDKFGYLYWINKFNGEISCKKYIHSSGIQSFLILDKNKLLIQSKKGIIYFFEIIKEL